MDPLHILDIDHLGALTANDKQRALTALEEGKVLYFPSYPFQFEDEEHHALLTDKILDGKHKNLSFDYKSQRLGGMNQQLDPGFINKLRHFMQGYAEYARELLETAFPEYGQNLIWGRTSYRPAQISGRASSKRKDDTRLHVDSFPATPVNGNRILRVFANVNPYGEPRVWHLGEPFNDVAERFASQIPKYNPVIAKLLHLIKATKTLRSAYDHYQLNLHDRMKLDDNYQQTVNKQRFDFPPQSTWIVFTDQVSHAALSGQFLLEQTFYLPVNGMKNPDLSPLKFWENKKTALAPV
ncbi:Kdo hydroxylase family protein [Legionella jordanis]|uniref:3-deoxy-D-manno-oct-2-ulosonic acid (Kdo) hydroxylase n=1 Tax=Legionella jordanis TaxID=456 RepID=A0A0W0V9E7_9GAMM|nr:Kdo hydroxylase family protein [Legionella jordanis]KTD16493.1 hypothetical protein Ljor_0799 [Legionella jordanis]RMX03960.1 hypothetical protein EAW55_06290 [Legionella jordanis]RMX21971.1 hypothetical protein EAS68_00115 [Legionella jordanis]VEH12047.1 Protein of uncharacterised function (DUF2843) [Legionella jordanis]HAT8712652.1 hypothetical protein [Legionella jordanis]